MAKGTWIPLDEVIYDYLSESEQSSHKFFKLWHISFRGMEQLGIDFFYQIKTIKLQVAGTKTAELPSDYGNYSKVGVVNSIGEIIPFTYNNNQTLYADANPSRLSKIQNGEYGYAFEPSSLCFYNFWDGFDFGNLYGIPSGGYTGSFRIDEANKLIVLGSEFSYSNIVLEYVALPKEGETYYLPSIFREALVAWISWKDISSAPIKRSVLDDKAARRREFYNERRLALARYKPFHLYEAHQWNVQSQRLTIKM
jgi:hypothetical protein